MMLGRSVYRQVSLVPEAHAALRRMSREMSAAVHRRVTFSETVLMAEGFYDRLVATIVEIVETPLSGAFAYHARCTWSGCDWRTERVSDRRALLVARARTHSATHLISPPTG